MSMKASQNLTTYHTHKRRMKEPAELWETNRRSLSVSEGDTHLILQIQIKTALSLVMTSLYTYF